MGVGRGEPVERLWDTAHECRARWRHDGKAAWDVAYLAVGVLGEGCRAYPAREQAWAVTQNWMRRRGGGWERVPCYPTQP